MDEPPLLQKMLSQLGLTRSLSKIKFGGVVGKQTLLGIALCTGLAAVALRSSDRYVQLLAIVLIFLAVLSIVAGNLWYAHKHPAEATLEGLEIVALQHSLVGSKFQDVAQQSPVVPIAPPGALPPPEEEL
jgi:hypothetical protein